MFGHEASAPTLDDIDALAREYQRSRVILTAVELDVFTAVGAGPTPAAVVAERVQSDPRATLMLLNALVALRLLTKTDDGFTCTDLVSRHLVEGAPEDARAPYLHGAQLWQRWSQLTDCVRSGKPAAPPPAGALASPRAFIGTMHRYALEQAPTFLAAIDLTDVSRILDLGGGSAAYAMAFARALPAAEVTVFDRPEIIELAVETLAAEGMNERVKTMSGDILTDDFGRGYDLVWLSNVVHAWGPGEVRACLRRVRQALKPNGRLLLRDFILENDGTAPEFGAVFTLNMLVSTEGGACYTFKEYRDWLIAAGFRDIHMIDVPGAGHTAIIEAGDASAQAAASPTG